jgi:hypothetical protein
MAWRDVNSGSGGGWRQSKKKKKEEPSYTETLEKRIGNYETRFGMMGEEPPKKTDTKTKLLKVLDYMDRPRNAVVNAIQDVSKGENGVLQGLSEGFRGQERANMSDFLDPNMNKYARGALGFIGDVALDPLTYLTFGAGGVAKKGVQEAGEAGLKAGVKNVASNTLESGVTKGAKELAQEGAEQAVKPRGAAAITKHMQNVRKAAKYADDEPARAARLAELEKELALAKGVANPIQEVARKAAQPRPDTYMKLFGQDVLNVSPIGKAIGASKLGQATKPLREGIADTLNPIFNRTSIIGKGNMTDDQIQDLTKTVDVIDSERRRATGESQLFMAGDEFKALKGIDNATAEKLFKVIELPISKGIDVDMGVDDLVKLAKQEGINLSKMETEALAKVKDIQANTLSKDLAAGVELDVLPNYIRHLYRNPPDVIKKLQNEFAARRSRLNPKAGFQKQRQWETVEAFEKFAKEMGIDLQPVKNVKTAVVVRELEGVKQRSLAKVHQGILQAGDNVIMAADQAPRNWVQLPIKGFEGKAVHPEIARHVDMMNKTFESDAGLKNLTNILNNVQNIWKGLVTTSIPFHLRNNLGNMYNNWLAGVVNPALYPMAAAAQKGTTAKFLINGVEMSGDDIMTAFRKQGLEGFGLYHGETTKTLLKTAEDKLGMTSRGLKNINPLNSEFAPVRGSRYLGDKIETNAKLAHFIDKLQKGFTPEEASASVRKYLFDYSDLTEAEKKIRGVIPFYTWTRKNLPVQLESLVKQPGKPNAVTHLIDNMQNTSGMEEEGMPDWLRNDMAIPIMVKDDGTQVYLSPNLPLANLNMLLGGKDQLRDMAGMITPLAKAPLELAMNRQFFSDQPVEKYEGATAKYGDVEMPAKYAYLLNQLGAIPRNVANIGKDVMDSQNPNAKSLSKSTLPENPDISGLQQTLLGSLLRDVNPERTRAIELIQREKQLADFRKKLEEVEGKEVPELTKKKKTTSTWR